MPVIDPLMYCFKTSVFRTNLSKVNKMLYRTHKKIANRFSSIYLLRDGINARKLTCAIMSPNLNVQRSFFVDSSEPSSVELSGRDT